MSGSNILFVLTGSIAAYKACEAVSQLVQRGHRVRTVATPSARRFIGAATLEGLTGERVGGDLFEPGRALDHIELGRWADAIAVCPATAHSLNSFAAGLAGDLAGALFLAHDWTKPFLVAPAMNPAMWSHPATAAAAERLRGWGVRFIEPGRGRTACGETGEGRMAEPAEVVAAIEAALAPAGRRLRVLITSGPTAERIDGVRVLTNLSTGSTGAGIADRFVRGGHAVVLLRAAGSAPGGPGCREETFRSFEDLDGALGRLLQEESFDAVIHAAAVGDFGIGAVVVDGVEHPPGEAKLSSASPPVLRLRRQPKLAGTLRARSHNPDVRVAAFKLTTGAGAEAARTAVATLFAGGGLDLVVHNDLTARAGPDAFPADIYRPDGTVAARCPTRADLAAQLEQLLLQNHLPCSSV